MEDSSALGWRAVPRTVWVLGFVSLFMDTSSEMIHALLPVFLVSTLGASATLVGLIEGIAEGTASVTKVFSGAISDWFGRRKLLAVLGYGLGYALAGIANIIEFLQLIQFCIGEGRDGLPDFCHGLADQSHHGIRGCFHDHGLNGGRSGAKMQG